MNRLALDKLITILVENPTGKLSGAQATAFFAWTRQTMEANKLDSFPVLETYCDWMLHTELNARKHQHLLVRITKHMQEIIRDEIGQPDVADGKQWFRKLVTTLLSLDDFHKQLIELLDAFGKKLADYASPAAVDNLLICACQELSERPINFWTKISGGEGAIDPKRAAKFFNYTSDVYAFAIRITERPTDLNRSIVRFDCEVAFGDVKDRRKLVLSAPLFCQAMGGDSLTKMGLGG
jgi:hypothetical protein